MCSSPAALADCSLVRKTPSSTHRDPTGHPEELGTEITRTPWLYEIATFKSSFSSSTERWPWEETFQLSTCVWELKGPVENTSAVTQLHSPPSPSLQIHAAAYPSGVANMPCNRQELQLLSQACMGKSNILFGNPTYSALSSAELQLQSLKSRAWMANCPYFTTVLQQPLHRPLPTFSALKLLACSFLTRHCFPALQHSDKGDYTTSPSNLHLLLLFFNAQLKIAFFLFLNSFFGVRQPSSDCAAL